MSCLFTGCQWELDEVEFVLVQTGEASKISSTSIEVTGAIVNLPTSGKITQYGHSWSSDPSFLNATSNDLGTPSAGGDFLTQISDLLPNTIYFIRSYAVYDEKTFYGDTKAMATSELAIITEDVQPIRGDSVAVLGSIFGLDGQHNIDAYGHCWSDINQLPELAANNFSDLGPRAKDGIFESTLRDLLPDKTYYVRSYALVNGQAFYDQNARLFNTRDVWYRKKDLPRGFNNFPLFRLTSIVIGNSGYTLFGSNFGDGYTDECWKYDPGEDSWILASHFPGHLRRDAGGFVIGNTAYYGYGSGSISGTGTATDDLFVDFWQFTPGQETEWRQVPNAPPLYLSYGFSIGNTGYLIGNFLNIIGAPDDQFWSYRPDEGWTRMPNDFPGTPRFQTVTFTIGDKAYVGLGGSADVEGGSLNDFWEFNATTGKWSPLPDFPGVSRIYPIVFILNGKAFLGGGIDNTSREIGLSDLWEFNPENPANPWTRRTDIPGLARNSSIYFNFGNRGYAGGGFGETFWEYVPPL